MACTALVVIGCRGLEGKAVAPYPSLVMLLKQARNGPVFIVELSAQRPGEPLGTRAMTGRSSEVRVPQIGPSAFYGTDLDIVLRCNGVEQLVLAGRNVDGAFDLAVREAFVRGYRVVIAEDAVLEEDAHRRALLDSASGFCARSTAEKIVSQWTTGTTPTDLPARPPDYLLETLEERVSPAHTALVLVDIQRDFCDESGLFSRRGNDIASMRRSVAKTRLLLASARKTGCAIVFIKSEYGPLTRGAGSAYRYPGAVHGGSTVTLSAADFARGPGYSSTYAEICSAGTAGAEFLDDLSPHADDAIVLKRRFSAFADTYLDAYLRRKSIKSLVIAGVTTNCCVESTVRDAVFKDFHVVVADDCVAAPGIEQEFHRTSLEMIRCYFARVVPSSEVIAAWERAMADA